MIGMLLALTSSTAMAQWGRPVDYAAGPGLKEAYKEYVTIGVAVNQGNISDPAQIEIIKKQYNSVTAENECGLGPWSFRTQRGRAEQCWGPVWPSHL